MKLEGAPPVSRAVTITGQAEELSFTVPAAGTPPARSLAVRPPLRRPSMSAALPVPDGCSEGTRARLAPADGSGRVDPDERVLRLEPAPALRRRRDAGVTATGRVGARELVPPHGLPALVGDEHVLPLLQDDR